MFLPKINKRRENMKKHLLALAIVFIFALLVSSVSATLSPAAINATLNPSESVDEHKTVFLSGTIPKGDVVFAFDLTGSMGDEIDEAKSSAIDIMTNLGALISDAQFGVMSFMDYPHSYENYHGYTDTYGDPASGDYAYNLDQPITSDTTAVSNAITGLSLGYGVDGPQDYTRIMYESYADAAVGWRPGAKRILVMFGDNVPHDDNLLEGISAGTYSTGGDPGRDEIQDTADDLDLQTVLSEMNTNNVVLLYVDSGDLGIYWDYWTSLAGGARYDLTSAEDIPAAIQTLVGEEAAHVDTLTLKAEAGYEAWLTSVVPTEYTDINIPEEGATREFDITITVPPGTPPGTYVFNIIADADGASYGEQEVTITVLGIDHVIPETPFGTILASASILIGFIAYIGIPRFRKTRKIASL